MSGLARWLLGWVWWWLVPIRRREARENLRLALPDATDADLRRAVGGVAWGYVELAIGRRPAVVGLEHLPDAGGVALMAHGVSWDLALVEIGRHRPVTVFVKTPSDRLAAAFIAHMRARSDLELLGVSGTMARAREALAEGRLVVFFVDQRHNAGVPVPFLGRLAWTSPAFAAMAWTERPVVVGLWPRLDTAAGHQLVVEPLTLPPASDRATALTTWTAATQRWVEGHVRGEPHGWWWLHRRWRAPPEAAAEATVEA